MTDVPHFTLPFGWATATGGLAARECEQDSAVEIAACAEAVIRTVQGQRTTLPGFGRPQVEFNTDPAFTRAVLAQALRDHEPRVETLVTAEASGDDELVQVVQALIAPVDEQEAGP
jgi:phage baseplate assembly protein W